MRLLYTERTEGRDSALVDLAASGGVPCTHRGSAVARLHAAAHRVHRRTCAPNQVGLCLQHAAPARRGRRPQAGHLRLAGRPAQAQTLATPDADTRTLQRLLEAASGKNLQWFFADWIDRDTGLPDLTIVSVAPRQIERGTVNNTVPAPHHPSGGPIGDLPVPQPGDPTGAEQGTTASRNQIGPRDGSWLVAVEVQNNGNAAAQVPVTVRAGSLQNSLPLRIAAHSRATIRVPFEVAPEEVWVNDGTTPEQRNYTHHRSLNGVDTGK